MSIKAIFQLVGLCAKRFHFKQPSRIVLRRQSFIYPLEIIFVWLDTRSALMLAQRTEEHKRRKKVRKWKQQWLQKTRIYIFRVPKVLTFRCKKDQNGAPSFSDYNCTRMFRDFFCVKEVWNAIRRRPRPTRLPKCSTILVWDVILVCHMRLPGLKRNCGIFSHILT